MTGSNSTDSEPPILNKKEQDYIGLIVFLGDPEQKNVGGGLEPTYNLVDWLRARNINGGKEIEPSGNIIDLKDLIEIDQPTPHYGDSVELRDYIEFLLEGRVD